MPTLKAYEYSVPGYDGLGCVMGQTASKARYKAWIGIDSDCIKLTDLRVRRAPDKDMKFPDLPSVNDELSDRDREIILNAFGGGSHIDPQQWGYRDHQCLSPTDQTMARFIKLGLFRGPYGVDASGDTPGWVGAFYYLTDDGKELARALIGQRECN